MFIFLLHITMHTYGMIKCRHCFPSDSQVKILIKQDIIQS
jgi:hypothetical protein